VTFLNIPCISQTSVTTLARGISAQCSENLGKLFLIVYSRVLTSVRPAPAS
jgi:hypothetical protein